MSPVVLCKNGHLKHGSGGHSPSSPAAWTASPCPVPTTAGGTAGGSRRNATSLAVGTDCSAAAGWALQQEPAGEPGRAWHSHFSLRSKSSRRPLGQGPGRPREAPERSAPAGRNAAQITGSQRQKATCPEGFIKLGEGSASLDLCGKEGCWCRGGSVTCARRSPSSTSQHHLCKV